MSNGHSAEKMIKLGTSEHSATKLVEYPTCHIAVRDFVKAGLPSEDGDGTDNINYFIAKHISLKEKINIPTVNIFSLGISIIVFLASILLVLSQLAIFNQSMTIEILSKFNLAIVNFDLLIIALSVAFFAISGYLILLIWRKMLSRKDLILERDCHNNIVLALQTIKANQN
ncbi:hypothetical protein [uncultured Clostridium sp.]|jgi:hypothetical protein|uniref:hypothetical protein n=1 Tax=uncultured Clostridium sp. TaxID=59620 RepID=UPI00261739B2|nr:hypothetical protein [uncultured Clostridium sp.]